MNYIKIMFAIVILMTSSYSYGEENSEDVILISEDFIFLNTAFTAKSLLQGESLAFSDQKPITEKAAETKQISIQIPNGVIYTKEEQPKSFKELVLTVYKKITCSNFCLTTQVHDGVNIKNLSDVSVRNITFRLDYHFPF